MKKTYIFTILFIFAAGITFAGIANTPHNLSVSGPGTVKSSTERRICIFCHTPHNARSEAPLWNRNLSNASYTVYSSKTFEATANQTQPTGNSRLCLSCHDGTIALNQIYSGTIQGTSLSNPLTGAAVLGTDLSDDHPISFLYSDSTVADNQLNSETSLPSFVKLQNGRVECTSCHDPHTETQYFLNNADINVLCDACHDKKTGTQLFADSPHSYIVTSSPVNAKYSCNNCHDVHNAKAMETGAGTIQLLRGNEEQLCFICHGTSTFNGAPVPSGTGVDIEANTAASPGTLSGTANYYGNPSCDESPAGECHEGEWSGTINNNERYYNKSHDVVSSAQGNNNTQMECINCHGPHGVRQDDLTTRDVIESLVDPDTLKPFKPSTTNYETSNYWNKFYQMNEFCLKCHNGSFPSSPAGRSDLTVSTDLNREPINVSNTYPNGVHGGGRGLNLPCMACHKPHSGNYMMMPDSIDWNIDNGAPFATNDASGTLTVSSITVNSLDDIQNFCFNTCHKNSSFSGHRSDHVDAVNNNPEVSCITCHFHGGYF
ncbi:cytochrome C family protein [Flexistipes sinusarabici DSM 4947]|uniref:Cytochrome C family protein n=1 Tax=Flexistipes sinusarabici (strain ATCC 49648 / DSM 4947 / MAS 10) TaxID=717231 RepID=F8E4R2_FLESM|nr:cytochrome c3 family protein [Flexistipes sinusarabici]AEI15620.1 cytochrome C family protein [Flexistipes sinusarabici DSM 4947]